MDHAEQPELAAGPGRAKVVRRERATPLTLHDRHLGSGPACHLGHARAEDPVHADEDGVPRLDQVHQAGLHPGGAGPGHGEGERVLGLEERPQLGADLVHRLQEERVEVPERRPRERLQHRRRHVGGTGAEQDPLGRREGRERCVGGGHGNGR